MKSPRHWNVIVLCLAVLAVCGCSKDAWKAKWQEGYEYGLSVRLTHSASLIVSRYRYRDPRRMATEIHVVSDAVRRRSLNLTREQGFDHYVVVSGYTFNDSGGSAIAVAEAAAVVAMRKGSLSSGGVGAGQIVDEAGAPLGPLNRPWPVDWGFDDYHPKDEDWGGYSEYPLGPETYQVIYEWGEPFYKGYQFWLRELLIYYRAAELTTEKGYDYFVLSPENKTEALHVSSSRLQKRSNLRYQSFLDKFVNFGGGVAMDVTVPNRSRYAIYNTSTIIKMFKGEPPENEYAAFVAKEVLANLGPHIKRTS